MKSFEMLPAEFRRSLARRELARRGAYDTLTSMSDAQLMRAAYDGLLRGLAGRESLPDAVRALMARLNDGTATDEDLQLLAGLPDCEMEPHDLVRTLVAVGDSF
jgi:hypothetical protein